MSAGFRFRPASRLLSGKDFSAVFSNRRVLRCGPFELFYTPKPLTESSILPGTSNTADSALHTTHCALGTARLGLIVPKRNAKRAVHRNLVKRIAREAFRHVLPVLGRQDVILRLARPLKPLPDGVCRHERIQWREQIDHLLSQLPR